MIDFDARMPRDPVMQEEAAAERRMRLRAKMRVVSVPLEPPKPVAQDPREAARCGHRCECGKAYP